MIGNSAAPHEDPVGFEHAEPAPLSLEDRLRLVEERLPEVVGLVASLTQLGQAVGQLQHQVAYLAQQRNLVELQMERHTRATALDLAIKAVPQSGGAEMTALAEAFVTWLKAAPPPAAAVQEAPPLQ